MVMASKSTVKKSASRSFVRKYGAVLLIGFLILAVGGAYGYNKNLDQQNISDMKQLLADFEQLEKDVEAETGEELILGAACGDLEEKFTKTPSCYVYLESTRDKPYNLGEVLSSKLPEKLNQNKSCAAFSGTGFTFSNSKKVMYSCYPLVFRASVKPDVEKIISPYIQ